MKNRKIFTAFLAAILCVSSINMLNERINAAETTEWNFTYKGQVEEFIAPYTGKYHIESAGGAGGGKIKAEAYDATEDGYMHGGKGGTVSGYINLLKGEKIYINVGGQAEGNKGGYNGGGSAENGFGGGGATTITTELITLEDIFSGNEEKLLLIAPGGGGLTNETGDDYQLSAGDGNSEKSSSQKGFGVNASGYWGAGGAGYYGGNSGNNSLGYFITYNGQGGTGYTSDKIYGNSINVNPVRENGYAKITLEKKVNPTVTITLGGGLSLDGYGNGTFSITSDVGDKIDLNNITEKEGYKFLEWNIKSENSDYDFTDGILTVGFDDIEIKAVCVAPLEISGSINKDKINLSFSENDYLNKQYIVYESADGTNFKKSMTTDYSLEKNPQPKNYDYSGSIESYTVPFTGYYNLKAYGAQGSNDSYFTGGNGGYIAGKFLLQQGDIIYVGVGEYGKKHIGPVRSFNGGGAQGPNESSGGGGGATHFALNSNRGELQNYSANIDEILLIAGGGGGGNLNGYGGGGDASGSGNNGVFGLGSSCPDNVNSTPDRGDGAGGGGGYRGGTYGVDGRYGSKGGSSWINTSYGTQTARIASNRAGNGLARIEPDEPTQVLTENNAEYWNKDVTPPETPSNEVITGKDNVIEITWKQSEDFGNESYYKVESYNTDTEELLNTSDIFNLFVISGLKGYHYYIDDNPTGTATKENAFTESNNIRIEPSTSVRYLHVMAVDYNGNESGTYDIKIPSIAKYIVKHQQEQLDGSYKTVETIKDMGTIGTSVTPEVRTYDGFTSPSATTKTIAADSSTEIIYQYKRNLYDVVYTDKINDSVLGERTVKRLYELQVDGIDNLPEYPDISGGNKADNAYYPNYRLIDSTQDIVGLDGAAVERHFEWITKDVEGIVTWIDNHNEYHSRPQNVKIVLFQNGIPVDSVDGPLGGESIDTPPIILSTNNDNNDFGFYNLPVYDIGGNLYNYEVRMFDVDEEIDFSKPSSVTSTENPESKYVTTQNGYNINNKLDNTAQDPENPDIPDDSNGFEVAGAIHWVDSGNKLGLRPHYVTISLLQDGIPFMRDGKPYEITVNALNDNTFDFVRLPKYKYVGGNPVLYEYTAVETFTSTYVNSNGEILPLYDIHTDENNGVYEKLHFTNYINIDGPIIPIIPEEEKDNEITVKTNTEDPINVVLKMLDFHLTGTSDNLGVKYGPDYNGVEFNINVSEIGETLKHIPSGKYEIIVNEEKYSLQGIAISDNTDNVKIVYEDGKYYLLIENVPENSIGTVNITLNRKTDYYQSRRKINNLFRPSADTSHAVMKLYAIFGEAEPVTAEVAVDSENEDETIINDIETEEGSYEENYETNLEIDMTEDDNSENEIIISVTSEDKENNNE